MTLLKNLKEKKASNNEAKLADKAPTDYINNNLSFINLSVT